MSVCLSDFDLVLCSYKYFSPNIHYIGTVIKSDFIVIEFILCGNLIFSFIEICNADHLVKD